MARYFMQDINGRRGRGRVTIAAISDTIDSVREWPEKRANSNKEVTYRQETRPYSYISFHPGNEHEGPWVDSLESDPSMRFSVSALLGAAIQDGQRVGHPVHSTLNLSRHSSPLVQRGVDMGLVRLPEGATTAPVANSMRLSRLVTGSGYFEDSPDTEEERLLNAVNRMHIYYDHPNYPIVSVPQHVVTGWHNTVRAALRPGYRPRGPITHAVNDSPQIRGAISPPRT